MAKVSVNTIKNWFQTGLKPTQSQFWDWLDSFRHKDDAVTIAEVTGLQAQLDALAGGGGGGGGTSTTISNAETLAIANTEMLQFMLVRSATTQVVKCGTSAGLGDIFNVEVASGSQYLHEEVFAPTSTLTLHFTCTGDFTLLYEKITFS